MGGMNPLYAHLYAHVMVLFWPWLWWQLRAIERWRQATGRGLLIAADQYGNVHVRWVEDAPDAAQVRAPVSDRLARALSGDDATFPYSRLTPGFSLHSVRACRTRFRPAPGRRTRGMSPSAAHLTRPSVLKIRTHPKAPSQAPHVQARMPCARLPAASGWCKREGTP